MKNPSGYSRLQITLHWVVSGAVALQYLLSDGSSDAYDLAEDTGAYAMSLLVIGPYRGRCAGSCCWPAVG